MLLAIALYGGALSGIEPFWEHTLRYYSMGLGVLSLAWPGRVFFRNVATVKNGIQDEKGGENGQGHVGSRAVFRF